jgi:hypothetical protein
MHPRVDIIIGPDQQGISSEAVTKVIQLTEYNRQRSEKLKNRIILQMF